MFTIKLKPTTEYLAKEVAQNTQRWLDGSIGIAEKTPDLARIRAIDTLACPEHGDELGKWYTIEVTQICENCGSDDIVYDDYDTDGDLLSVPCSCNDCRATWQNEYSFTQTFNLEK